MPKVDESMVGVLVLAQRLVQIQTSSIARNLSEIVEKKIKVDLYFFSKKKTRTHPLDLFCFFSWEKKCIYMLMCQ